MEPHAYTTALVRARVLVQSGRGRPGPHSIQTVQAPPPNLIRERAKKTPGALLCMALTSVLHMNKTDFEMLRASFGIRLPAPPHSRAPSRALLV